MNFQKGQIYKVKIDPQSPNPKGEHVRIDEAHSSLVRYTYLESGLKGSARIGGQWLRHFELVGEQVLTPQDDRPFYICWAPCSNQPPRVKMLNVLEAEAAAARLVEQKGLSEVYIMQVVGVARRPSATVTQIGRYEQEGEEKKTTKKVAKKKVLKKKIKNGETVA